MRRSMPRVGAVVALLVVLFAPAAHAATFTVDTTMDDPAKTTCDDATPNDCSLRGAVIAANALAAPTTVVVPAGTYVITQTASCTYTSKGSNAPQTLSVPALCVSGDVTIAGAGAASTIIDGNGQHRVLLVGWHATADVSGVTLTNAVDIFGGAVQNQGTLRLTDSVITGNTTPDGSGGAAGAGIDNFDVATLVRCSVSGNFAPIAAAGAGIYNDGFRGASMTIIDSLVSNNTVRDTGGGIANAPAGILTIIGSTIAGNTATGGLGGGVYNDGTLTMIDSTISGNQSGSSGGGLTNAQNGTTHLNNVTITANTSGTAHNGQGGGLDNSLGHAFTFRNTIIAGNTDLSGTPPTPDCDARTGFSSALTSEGYNLVGNAAHCDIAGDMTGNIIGQDPKLGALLNNGGPTPTNAPAADSPVVDAGNPAAPGSGGLACAATDQRGFVRPIGDHCDIGAVERTGAFALTQITPNVGGDIGLVSAVVAGSGFVDGASVTLTRAGQPDIDGVTPTVDPGGSAISTRFDLAGKALGAWDIVVTNPDTTTLTLPAGFTIRTGHPADPWVNLIGVLTRHPARLFLFYGNRGDVDADAVPLTIAADSPYGLARFFPITLPPAIPQRIGEGAWADVPITVTTGAPEGFTNVPLLLPVIPAGFSGILQIQLTLFQNAPVGRLVADVGSPFFTPTPDPQVVATMVQGARDYAASEFQVTIPSSLDGELSDYVTAQLEQVVADGRAALIDDVGASSQVYSLAQLQFDVALFGAIRALQLQMSAAPMDLLRLLAHAGSRVAPWLASLEPPAAFAQTQSGDPCKTGGVLPEGHSCTSTGDTISPKAPDNPKCSFEALRHYAENPLSNPRPDCSPTESDCNAMANHVVRTLPGGGKICQPIGCDESKADGYQNTSHCRSFPIDPMQAHDPNAKAGSLGAGGSQFVLGDTPFDYVVHFENLDTATGPAATVVVTDPLDTEHLDLDTFSLGAISFGDVTLTPSPGMIGYTGSVDLRPARDIIVTVDAELDEATGTVTWRFDTIDPETGASTDDPSVGFLPPNTDPPAGEGVVAFSVKPKAALATGTQICNQASIVFDQNDPLATESWCNAIDTAPPSSSVQALASTQANPTFLVQWSGTDAGAGVAAYTVFASDDGGPFTPFVTETTDTSAMFPGVTGHVYAFYSVARDPVGNVEPAPATPDTRTAVGAASGPHDLAITAIKAGRVTLSAKKPSVTKQIKVTIQNRGPGPEMIASAATLAALVHATLTSSGSCIAPVAAAHQGKPKKKLPFILKSKRKLTVLLDATFDCANDPAKGAGHEDFTVSAHVDTTALGEIDSHAADDDCPRQVTPPGAIDPFPDGKLLDKGCGAKKRDKTFGAPVTIDVTIR